MTESNPVLVPAQGDQPQIVKLGTLAAQNLALALNLDEAHVATIEKAITDEINAMSVHFTLAFADVQTQYEATTRQLKQNFDNEVAKLTSSFNFVSERPVAVVIGALAVLVAGVFIGLYA